jgi:hypothetical protein
MATWGDDDLTQFLQVVNSNQMGNLARFPEEYCLIQRVNDCFSTGGEHLINPKPVATGMLFLRPRYAKQSGPPLIAALLQRDRQVGLLIDQGGFDRLFFVH